MPRYLHTAADLHAAILDMRSDARAAGIEITRDWCREQMHALGVTRYEDCGDHILSQIADEVDVLASTETFTIRVVSFDPTYTETRRTYSATTLSEALTMAERDHVGTDVILGIVPEDYETAKAEGIAFNEANGLLI